MAEKYVLDDHTALSLLNPALKTSFPTEEQQHPWHTDRFETFEMPFLRIWDRCSGSQPDENKSMMARAPHQRLNTIESRKISLAKHLKHSDWTSPTPYISFTNSPAAVQDLVNVRAQRNRGHQSLTAIDPNTRLRKGLPILDVAAEIDHYNIQDPYRKSNKYCNGHYVCLWQVAEREIVGHWQWDDLVAPEDWYQAIMMPAFRLFGRIRCPWPCRMSLLTCRMS